MESEADKVLVTFPCSQVVMVNPKVAWLPGNTLFLLFGVFFKLHLQGTNTLFILSVSHPFIL